MAAPTTFHGFKPLDIRGRKFDFGQFKGKWTLVVNTASKCGFTPQYEGLEALYNDLGARSNGAFTVVAFPCDQFGHQEPGSSDDIDNFCKVNYGVSFPVMSKIDVNGDGADPLYQWLKNEKPGLMGIRRVKWNFEKFLVDPEGKVVHRWASVTKPSSISKYVAKAMGLPAGPGDAATDSGDADNATGSHGGDAADAAAGDDAAPVDTKAAAADTTAAGGVGTHAGPVVVKPGADGAAPVIIQPAAEAVPAPAGPVVVHKPAGPADAPAPAGPGGAVPVDEALDGPDAAFPVDETPGPDAAVDTPAQNDHESKSGV